MNFFEQQDLARRNTRLLVLMFLVAVLGLVLLTNVLVAGFLYVGDDYNIYGGSRDGVAGFWSYFSWQRFGGIGLGVTATVAMVVLVKWLQLSAGGKAVAEGMGGTRILPQTRDKAERRCLNIVEELALAANMPVPPVYVLNSERGINAFAAGSIPADAVVAVTRGTLEHLKRHELQGVIGHEFSHILNGDMRLNIRLAAMLKGITFIGDVGHLLMRASTRPRTGLRDDKGAGAALPLLGLALFVLGWLGGLAAGFIKAAISRQKEFLADASAVQYTRDPDGIGDALKVIGGYIPGTLVHAARATELSHIFFGQVEHRLWQMFATHPPLDERIRRVDSRWNGDYIQRKVVHYREEPSHPGAGTVGVGRAAIVAAAAAAAAGNVAGVQEALAQAGNAGQLLDFDQEDAAQFAESAAGPANDADFDTPAPDDSTGARERAHLPPALVEHSRDPLGASALVLSLLVARDDAVRQKQLQLMGNSGVTGLEELVNTLSPGVAELGPNHRLPLLELCIPSLKTMSAKQYRVFKDTLLQTIKADRRTELYEWCLFQLTRHYLDPEFLAVKPVRYRYRRLGKVAHYLRVVLSVLAHEGSGSAEQAFRLGADSLGLEKLTLMALEDCSVSAFSNAAQELGQCYPLLKPRILKAMALAASANGDVCDKEKELVRALAAVMDCPIPDDPDSPLADFNSGKAAPES